MTAPETFPSKLLEEAVQSISSLPGVGKRSALRLALHLLRQPSENVRHFADSIVRMRDEAKYCRECWMISDNDVCPICLDKSRDHRTICVVENVRDVMSIENTGQYRGVYHVLGGIISPIAGVGPSDLTVAQLEERIRNLVGAGKPVSAGASTGSASAPVTEPVEVPGPAEAPHPVTEPAEVPGPAEAPHPVTELVEVPESAEVPDSVHPEDIEVILALSGDVEGETTSFYIYRRISPYGVKVSSLARGLGFGDDLEYADELTLGRSIVNRQIFKP